MVCIITRTKNRGTLLRRALLSVAQQTFNDYLHIIVNDGGRLDDVTNALSFLSQEELLKVRVISNELSLGMESASNIGINSNDSKFIVIHDDDDSWQVDFLRRTTDFLQSHPDIMGVVTKSYMVAEKIAGDEINILYSSEYKPRIQQISLFDILKENSFPPIAFVYRREALDKIGIYDENLPVLGDWDFNIRFLSNFDIDLIDERLANYHHRFHQIGDNGNSIINGLNMHKITRNKINNKLFRRDLQSGKIGIGVLTNLLPFLADNSLKLVCKKWISRMKIKIMITETISFLFKDSHSNLLTLRFKKQGSDCNDKLTH